MTFEPFPMDFGGDGGVHVVDIGTATTNGGQQRSGCRAFDLVMSEPCSTYNAITFRNCNTYSVSILFQSSIDAWEVVFCDYNLMPSPHVRSRESSAWVLLPRHTWAHTTDGNPCICEHRVRVILKQPSPHWKHFGILDFSFACVNTEDAPSEPLSTCPSYEINLLSS